MGVSQNGPPGHFFFVWNKNWKKNFNFIYSTQKLFKKEISDAYLLWPFAKKFSFGLVMRVKTRDYRIWASYRGQKISEASVLFSLIHKMNETV